MFQVKEKIHKMNFRNEKQFEVKFAHTERLKSSAIPYMQRILNLDFKENVENNAKRFRKPG